jgi:hypothetical protein
LADIDFIEKLRRDTVEQFKGKPNIEAYQEALARQLSELHEFFDGLNTLRWLQSAEGVQLDGIGDIVVLSRLDAIVISRQADMNVPMDDETYRLFLAWKISLNTTNCTHTDRYRALKMFWNKTPIYYSENPERPATIFLTIPDFTPETAVFRITSMIKAAGVALHFTFKADVTVTDYDAGAVSETIWEFIIGDQTEIQSDAADYHAGTESAYFSDQWLV